MVDRLFEPRTQGCRPRGGYLAVIRHIAFPQPLSAALLPPGERPLEAKLVNRTFEMGRCAPVLRNMLNKALTPAWHVQDAGSRAENLGGVHQNYPDVVDVGECRAGQQ